MSGTALAAQLSPTGEGNGIGIFNASSALAGVVGAAGGGWLAKQWGEGAVTIFGVVGIVIGLAVSGRILSTNGDKKSS
ncbi:MAG: hypothetical protein WHS90_07795 [Caldilinea sp.]|uniref:hypothetical protein n=1 Tax=Caldilinea sp. TaxID=2293560 RepID=UPI0030A85410